MTFSLGVSILILTNIVVQSATTDLTPVNGKHSTVGLPGDRSSYPPQPTYAVPIVLRVLRCAVHDGRANLTISVLNQGSVAFLFPKSRDHQTTLQDQHLQRKIATLVFTSRDDVSLEGSKYALTVVSAEDEPASFVAIKPGQHREFAFDSPQPSGKLLSAPQLHLLYEEERLRNGKFIVDMHADVLRSQNSFACVNDQTTP